MAIGSGLGATFGTGIETAGSYGTLASSINKAHALDSCELKSSPVWVKGNGLHAGYFGRFDAEVELTNLDAKGTIKTHFYYNGMLRWMASLMGGLAGPGAVTPVQNGTGNTSYTTTLPIASTWNQSLSIQEGIPDVSGVLHYWNTLGAKVGQAQFDCAVGQGLNTTLSIDAQDRYEVTSGTAQASPAGAPFFQWRDMSVKIGAFGSEVKVDGIRKWAGTIKRAQSDKRFNAGNLTTNPNNVGGYGIKDEPNDNGWIDITGTLETEYLNDALVENYLSNNTPFSLIVGFTSNANAGTGNPYSVTFNFPRCRFLTGDQPTVKGPDIIQPTMPYEVLNDGTHSQATITIVSQESAL